MTREVNDRIPPREDELSSWADSAPDWREHLIDEIYHERNCDGYQS